MGFETTTRGWERAATAAAGSKGKTVLRVPPGQVVLATRSGIGVTRFPLAGFSTAIVAQKREVSLGPNIWTNSESAPVTSRTACRAWFVWRSARLCSFRWCGGTRSGAEQPGDLGAEPVQVCRNHLDRGLGELEELQYRQVSCRISRQWLSHPGVMTKVLRPSRSQRCRSSRTAATQSLRAVLARELLGPVGFSLLRCALLCALASLCETGHGRPRRT